MRCRRMRNNRRVLQVSQGRSQIAVALGDSAAHERLCCGAAWLLCLDRAAQAKSWSSSAAFSSPQRKIGMWGSP